jgi:hypothetical protein
LALKAQHKQARTRKVTREQVQDVVRLVLAVVALVVCVIKLATWFC